MLDESEPLQLVGADISELSPPISKREKRPKFSKEDREAIGSFDSIELLTFLERPSDRLARLIRAASDFKFELTDADREAIKRVNREERNPANKEALKHGIKDVSRKAQKLAHMADRLELVQHIKTLKAYRSEKQRIPPSLRTPARLKAAAITADLQVEPTRGAELRRSKKRGRPTDERRKHLKAHRKQWGWRGRNVNKGVQSNWLAGDYSFWQGQEGAGFIGAGGFASISELDLAYPHSRDMRMREIEVTTKRLKMELEEFYDRRSKEESALSKVFDDPTKPEGTKCDENESE